MSIKVSVVVPVWNPGPYIEPCIASLLGQSLPSDEYEVIFVDDGSTDATPARLDALAAERADVRVIHIPNSGWPGRPRNVGIEAARGEYVQFVDQDDQLAPEALERLHAMGVRNGSDIVIGKVAGSFRLHAPVGDHAIRGVPQVLFRQNRESCTIFDAPLIDSLTPHKMFRRTFLEEHALRFPEGRMRLEDQLFIVPAYFAASVVSVLADYVCYRYQERDDGGNAGSVAIDPAAYYADLRTVLEIVIANTEPGDARNMLLRRFYRGEMLGRLSEPSFHRLAPTFRAGVYAQVRSLADDLLDPGLDLTLAPMYRLRAAFLREDRLDALTELSDRLASTRVAMDLVRPVWTNGRLNATFNARLDTGLGAIFQTIADGRRVLDPALTEGLRESPFEVRDEEVRGLKAQVLVRDRSTGAQWTVPTKSTLEDDGSDLHLPLPVVGTSANLDPLTVAGGDALGRGIWEVWVRVTGLGLDRSSRVASDRSASVEPAILGHRSLAIVPFHDDDGGLSIDVGPQEHTLADALDSRRVRFVRDGRRLVAVLPIASGSALGSAPVVLVLRHGESASTFGGRLEARSGRVLLRASPIGQLSGLPRGAWSLSVRLDGPDGPAADLGTVRTRRFGRVTVDGPRRVSGLANVRWVLGDVARMIDDRLPAPAQRAARSGLRALGLRPAR